MCRVFRFRETKNGTLNITIGATLSRAANVDHEEVYAGDSRTVVKCDKDVVRRQERKAVGIGELAFFITTPCFL